MAALTALLRGEAPAAADVLLSPATVSTAERHGVAPLLADCLQRAGVLGREHPLAAVARRAAASAAVRDAEIALALATLHDRRVPCLVFKGAHLAHSVYARSDLRPRMDTDLLIREADRDAAHTALEAAGYERVQQFSGDLVAYQAPYVRRKLGAVVDIVDLHWRIANPQLFGAVLATDELFAASEPLPPLGDAARGPGVVHALMLACVHPVAHHGAAPLLIWMCDIARLAARMTDSDWNAFVRLAIARRVGRVCAHGLEEAVEAVAAPVPAAVLADLGNAPASEPSARFLARDRRHVQTIWADLRTLSSWRDRWRLMQQHAFPPPQYMRQVYAPASSQPLMVLYARRMLRGARKWLARA